MNIRTQYDPKPIPLRDFDWSAVDADTYDYTEPVGWGRTEAEAIADLMNQIEEDETCLAHATATG